MTVPELAPDLSRELRDPHLLTAEEIAGRLRGAPWLRYAAVGDSIVEGTREPVEGYGNHSWADRLAVGLRGINPGLEYRNLGVRDLTAARVRETQLDAALAFAPDLAVVVAGGNDMLGKHFDADAVEREQVRIVSALRETGCTVVTMGLFDNTWTPYVAEKYKAVMRERIQRFSELTRGVSERLGGLHVDLPAHPAGKEPIFSSDGLHLNARGQAVVATEIVRVLGDRLAAGLR
ncbi:SGNH/GDSL hydrolase family protein (plasmid) [Streptomyces sp. BI20]|uniref:SGNH/GDSL hydrolase family protein n=1 Tax=Streptomyces sp. BI20 TaxID=3403460 RepID=UPI003C774B96